MSTFLWIVLGVLYFTALIVLGVSTLRKGHTVLFWLGVNLLLPLDRWCVAAHANRTPAATAAEAGDSLQHP